MGGESKGEEMIPSTAIQLLIHRRVGCWNEQPCCRHFRPIFQRQHYIKASGRIEARVHKFMAELGCQFKLGRESLVASHLVGMTMHCGLTERCVREVR